MPGDGDALLRLALLSAAAIALLSLLLMLQVLLIAQASARRQRLRSAFQDRWRPVFAAESLGVANEAHGAPAGDLERRWWLQLWTRMQATVRGEAHARLNRLMCSLDLDRHAVELLGRRDMRGQLLALACLRQLGDPGYWSVIAPVLQARNPIKATAAADALVAIDPARAMREVLPTALQRRDWARHRLAWLCKRAGPDAVTPPLLELLRKSMPEAPRQRLMGLLEFAHARAIAPWARKLLDAGALPASGVERAAALGVLCALRDPADHDRIVHATRDPDPDVRLAATMALGTQATTADTAHLLPLLADRGWAVRQAAAETLAALPGLSASALEALAADVFDRYGREALQRAIVERRP